MLSEASATTIRATLPAVGAAIGEISALFYDKLFAAHPDLLRDLFNRANQANGTQREALAGAFAAYATSLVDHPATPSDARPAEAPATHPATAPAAAHTAATAAVLDRIAHKHASLGITRDQYTVVHTHLFAAIGETLGSAATAEVVAAWDEVYWQMAETLAATEDRLYAEAGVEPGDGWRDYRVTARHAETPDVATFVVRPADGSPAPGFRPGQYVSVRVELPDGARQIRQYSLSGGGDGVLHFTVKKVTGDSAGPDGEVSNALHAGVHPGDTVSLSAPFGDLTLDDGEGPVLLASAGIGCTPMMGMISHLAATGSPRHVIAAHADRTPRTHAFRDEFARYADRLPHAETHVWYEEPEGPWPADRTGYPDLTTVPLPEGVEAYLCGPFPFLRAAREQLVTRGVPADRIRYEVFGPDTWRGTTGG